MGFFRRCRQGDVAARSSMKVEVRGEGDSPAHPDLVTGSKQRKPRFCQCRLRGDHQVAVDKMKQLLQGARGPTMTSKDTFLSDIIDFSLLEEFLQ